MAVFTNTSNLTIYFCDSAHLVRPITEVYGYLNFSIYATSVRLALSYNQCLVSILFADVLENTANTAIPTSNIIFVNVFSNNQIPVNLTN